jgi:hypothetical protein
MKITHAVTCLALAAALSAGIAGCETTRAQMRPDMDRVLPERGLQSRDLREMTDRMAPDLLTIPEIVQNPYKVTVVMKTPKNKFESDPTRDLTIYVARLKALLNSSASRDKIAFVEEQATLRNFQAQELGNRDPFEEASRNPGVNTDPRVRPQYVLTGDFYEMNNGRTSYYLCTFHLLDINTGVQVWEKPYEVRTLN